MPSEKTGTLAQRKDGWGPGDTLSAAIGQGDNSFTPIQIANIFHQSLMVELWYNQQ